MRTHQAGNMIGEGLGVEGGLHTARPKRAEAGPSHPRGSRTQTAGAAGKTRRGQCHVEAYSRERKESVIRGVRSLRRKGSKGGGGGKDPSCLAGRETWTGSCPLDGGPRSDDRCGKLTGSQLHKAF